MIRNWLNKGQKGQTLVELLIAVGLFSTVSVLALNVFVNVTRIQGRIALENAIYEDARFMMERMSRAIRNNTIDYEEYFNKGINKDNQYGDLYGCYAAQFYNPGKGAENDYAITPGKLGAYCTSAGSLVPYYGQDNCVVYKPSIDLNTGKFPYTGSPELTGSNAFCPRIFASTCSVNDNSETVKELYLIDKDGRTKTIFAQKKIKTFGSGIYENALALLKVTGKDENNDGITEKWRNCDGDNSFCCAEGFDCPDTLGNLESTLTYVAGNTYKGFIPISPLRSNVTDLSFTISPTEDPRKAFAEGNLSQPSVKISLTVRPSQDQLNKYGNFDINEIPSITLQTTISTRIQSEVKSYLGSDTYKIGDGLVPAVPSPNHSDGGHCFLPQL